MNETQAVFTLFFAISWGTVANVLPTWKPFQYSMFWVKNFGQPTRRVLFAFLMFNVLPWLIFGLILYTLARPAGVENPWTAWATLAIVLRGVLPGFVPFGLYRLWLAAIQCWPDCFYAKTQDDVPVQYRVTEKNKRLHPDPHEPSQDSLDLKRAGAGRNVIWGLLYVALMLLALFPGPSQVSPTPPNQPLQPTAPRVQ